MKYKGKIYGVFGGDPIELLDSKGNCPTADDFDLLEKKAADFDLLNIALHSIIKAAFMAGIDSIVGVKITNATSPQEEAQEYANNALDLIYDRLGFSRSSELIKQFEDWLAQQKVFNAERMEIIRKSNETIDNKIKPTK